MRTLIAMCVALVAVAAMAEEPRKSAPAAGTKIYQTDAYGNVQHHKPSLVVKSDGRIQPVDAYGNVQSHKPGFQVQGNRVYQTDPYGNVQSHKSSYTVQPDGRVIATDAYGNTQSHKPQFVVKDGTVYQADSVGHPQQPVSVMSAAAGAAGEEVIRPGIGRSAGCALRSPFRVIRSIRGCGAGRRMLGLRGCGDWIALTAEEQ